MGSRGFPEFPYFVPSVFHYFLHYHGNMDQIMSKRCYPEPQPFRNAKKVIVGHRIEQRCFHTTELRKRFEDMGYSTYFGDEEDLSKVPCGFIYKQIMEAKLSAKYYSYSLFDINKLGSSTDFSVAGLVRENLLEAQRQFPCPYTRDPEQAQHACTQTRAMLEILGTNVVRLLSKNKQDLKKLLEVEKRAQKTASGIFAFLS